jgi:ribokinase
MSAALRLVLSGTGQIAPNRYAPLVIVVIGHPTAVQAGERVRPGGTAALAAIEAARAGASVQLVGRIGDDAAGDAVLMALARANVGHVALLRDPSRPTPVLVEDGVPDDVDDDLVEPGAVQVQDGSRPTLDAADVELGLRYLTDYRVIVLAEPLPDEVVKVASDAASYSGAELVAVASGAVPALPARALVIEAASAQGDSAVASLLGTVAAAIDAGASPDDALDAALTGVGATPAT